MTQLVARIGDDLAEAIDKLVASGAVASRSDAVRIALEHLVDEHRRAEIGRQIVEGYRTMPQTDEETAGSYAATVAMIADEPW